MKSVVVYTRSAPRCAFCVQAKALLAVENIPFTERDTVGMSDEARAEFLDLIGRPEHVTVPQVFIGGRHVGGFSALKKLYDDGALHPMVAGE